MRLSAPPPTEAEVDALAKSFLDGLEQRQTAPRRPGATPAPTLSLSQLERLLDAVFRLLETLVADVAGVDHMLLMSVSESRSASSAVSAGGTASGVWAQPWVEQALKALSVAQADDEAVSALTLRSSVLRARNDDILAEILRVKIAFQMAFKAGELRSTKEIRDLVEQSMAWRAEHKAHKDQALRITARLDGRSAELRAHAEALSAIGGPAQSHMQEALKSVATNAPNIVHLCHAYRQSSRGGTSGNSGVAKGVDDVRTGLRGASATLTLLGGVLGRLMDTLDDLDGWGPAGVDASAPRRLRSEVYVIQAQTNGALDALGTLVRPDVRVISSARAALDRAWVLTGELVCLLRELPDEDAVTKCVVSARQQAKLRDSVRSFLRERAEEERNLDAFLRWFHSEYDDVWFQQNLQRLQCAFADAFEEVLGEEKQEANAQEFTKWQEQFKAATLTSFSSPAKQKPKQTAAAIEPAGVAKSRSEGELMADASVVCGGSADSSKTQLQNTSDSCNATEIGSRSEERCVNGEPPAELTAKMKSLESKAMMFQPPDRVGTSANTMPLEESNKESGVAIAHSDSAPSEDGFRTPMESDEAEGSSQVGEEDAATKNSKTCLTEASVLANPSQEELMKRLEAEKKKQDEEQERNHVESKGPHESPLVEIARSHQTTDTNNMQTSAVLRPQESNTVVRPAQKESVNVEEAKRQAEDDEESQGNMDPLQVQEHAEVCDAEAVNHDLTGSQAGAVSSTKPIMHEAAEDSHTPQLHDTTMSTPQLKKTWSRSMPLKRAESDSPDLLETQSSLFDDPDVLFLITRSKNDNVVVYRYVADDQNQPCEAFWWDLSSVPRPAHNRAELIWLEKKFAYGVTAKKISDSEFRLTLVALKSRLVTLQRGPGGPCAMASISGRTCALYRIFVMAVEAIPMPKVKYVNIHGVDLETGNEVVEKVLP
eukprot:gnl/MRDRNA2_/MRDRNA2_116774_c0_seq1.p1 gnl/MRDRNA2_/MRDRNA2_116774_c0~~gnl/MRDRNA2_/MRDRNA2_116774_c0_seq1.p1  ORF type:complete len:942 (+),score=239.42 gnl/MRDRNA2_/MRDRNA2_116774_c0_seq1:79-2904(+)